jgi:transposase
MPYENEFVSADNKVFFGKKCRIMQYERQSLKEIEKTLLEKKYKTKNQAKQHMVFLRKLAEKLRKAVAEEQQLGLNVWELNDMLKRVKETYDLIAKEVSSLPDKETIK